MYNRTNDIVAEFLRRIAARIEKLSEQDGECRIWTGATNNQGYGVISMFGRPHGAHRVVWQLANGPIPDDADIHHSCKRRLCVLAAHLEALTRIEHNRVTHPWITHCKHGHEFTPENTYVTSAGLRHCQACRRERRGPRKPLPEQCPHGHPYDAENTYLYVDKQGFPHRLCRACRRAKNYERQLARAKKRGGEGYRPPPPASFG